MSWLVDLIFTLSRRVQVRLDAVHNQWQLKKNNVNCLGALRIRGRIIIKNKGCITLGNRVLISNSSEFNPVGLPHSTILATLNERSSISIGDGSGISGASIVSAKQIVIGNNVLVGGGAAIWDTDFHPLDAAQRLMNPVLGATSERVIIGDNVFIGARAIILKGVTIGSRAVIGAGAVITRNVPEDSIAIGNPMIINNK